MICSFGLSKLVTYRSLILFNNFGHLRTCLSLYGVYIYTLTLDWISRRGMIHLNLKLSRLVCVLFKLHYSYSQRFEQKFLKDHRHGGLITFITFEYTFLKSPTLIFPSNFKIICTFNKWSKKDQKYTKRITMSHPPQCGAICIR